MCRRQLAKTLEGSLGPAILYFGCRSRKQDFLYRDELQAFAEDGILTKLELAFSRETAEKVYVQDLMKRQVCGKRPFFPCPRHCNALIGRGHLWCNASMYGLRSLQRVASILKIIQQLDYVCCRKQYLQ